MACPRVKSKNVTRNITKFGVHVYPAKFSTPIDYGWPWPTSSRSFGLKTLEIGPFWLVRTISQKVLHGISPNLHQICILPSFQYLINMGDLDLHFQGHLSQKYLKFGYFQGLSCMVNYGIIYSPMAFQLCTNRVHVGIFNRSSGFFEIQK